MRVAGGDDPVQVLEAMFLHPEGQHLYMPPAFTGRRTFDQHKLVGEDKSLTKVNGDWLDKWHHENPEYEIREYGSEPRGSKNRREKPHFAGDDPNDPEAVGRHHQVHGNVYHKETGDKVGDFGFSLARWPLLSRGGHSPVVTAHVHSLFRNQFERDHEGMMTHTLDSYVNHAKDNGVRHVYVNEDVSNGYWLKNVARHPEMVWGGVEYKELKGHTNDYDTIANRRSNITRAPDRRGARLIQQRQDLFHGWPGYHESLEESGDSYRGLLHIDGRYEPEKFPGEEHGTISRRLGYDGTSSAMRNGWIRHINVPHNQNTNYYEFIDDPSARRAIARHLSKNSRVGDRVVFDPARSPESLEFDTPSKAHSWLRGTLESVDETDAFTMRWNQSHPRPEGMLGPIPTTLMRFEKGTTKKIPSHMDKRCYIHAVKNFQRNPNLKIGIGFAVQKEEAEGYERGERAPMMFTHAFNVNRRGEVHDTTIGQTGPDRMRYYGHVVPDHIAQGFKNGGDLHDWFGQHFQSGTSHTSSIHLGQMKDIDHANSK